MLGIPGSDYKIRWSLMERQGPLRQGRLLQQEGAAFLPPSKYLSSEAAREGGNLRSSLVLPLYQTGLTPVGSSATYVYLTTLTSALVAWFSKGQSAAQLL